MGTFLFILALIVFSFMVYKSVIWENSKKKSSYQLHYEKMPRKKENVISHPIIQNDVTGKIAIQVSQLNKYTRPGSMIKEAVDLQTDAIFSGDKTIFIAQSKLIDFERKMGEMKSRNLESSVLYEMKQNAQGLEKAGNFTASYEAYKKLILFATSSKSLRINNYSHDINRCRIVANKLKRKTEYEAFIAGVNVPKT